MSLRQIRAFGRRAATIQRKAEELADALNREFGFESDISGLVDDVVCSSETLTDVLKAGGRP